MKHGHRPRGIPTPTYYSWQAMKNRCDCPGASLYELYGGRGISVCEKWKSFQGFLEDMGERPEGTSLDRIDPNKGYFKDNCRWATRKQQQRNRRDTRFLTFNGETKSLREWAEIYDLGIDTLWYRVVTAKWPAEKALTTRPLYNHSRRTKCHL